MNISTNEGQKSFSGKILIALTGGAAVGLSIICLPFLAPAFRKYCLPFVPATTLQIENVLKGLGAPSSANELLLDIGSGDGRIVVATAKQGFHSHGVELNPWLLQYSRVSSLRHGVWNHTKFIAKDLWKYNVSPYKYIIIFGVEQMMTELEGKLQREVQAGSKIIACRFPLPNSVPAKVIGGGVDRVWVYESGCHQ